MPSPITPLVKTPFRQRLAYALWALAFIGLGGVILLAHLRPDFIGGLAPVLAYWPALLIVIGLGVVFWGLPAHRAPLPTFALERGEYQAAHLLLHTSLADLSLNAFAGNSQLLVGQFPAYAGPRAQIKNSRITLHFDRRFAAPFLWGAWQSALAKGLPWTCVLRSTLGDFTLNLRDLTVPHLDLQSWLGQVDLTLPAVGQSAMRVHLGLGNLTLRVPDGLAVKLILDTGWLAKGATALDPQRFIRVSPHEWVTPHFSASPHQCTLTIHLLTGDLKIV